MKNVVRVLCVFGVFAAAPLSAATRTWTGAVNNLWSAGGNWIGGVAPVSGDDLVFPAAGSNTNTVNDLAGLTLSGVIIERPSPPRPAFRPEP
jgi:hypothetical protein